MSISLANKLAKDKFFLPPSKYINHKVVEIISLNDKTEMVSVILQKYGISKSKLILNPYGVDIKNFRPEKKKDKVFRIIFSVF